MAKEDTQVHLVLAVNQNILSYLDAFITIRGGDKMACLETIQNRLNNVSFIQMLVCLK